MSDDRSKPDPLQALKRGDLAQALADVQEQIRKAPAHVDLRVFLFQLLCVQGNWARALMQLQTTATLDPSKIEFVQAYHHLINAEAFRRAVFNGEKTPLVFGDSSPWIPTLLNALKCEAQGDLAAACVLRAQALEAAPIVKTSVNGLQVDWFSDADSRLGPAIELMVNGGFYWIPQDAIKEIVFDPVQDLRDLIWRPLSVTFVNEGKFVGFMPVRYPGSELSENTLHQLARITEWQEIGQESYKGLGQRMFATPDSDLAILDIESIQFSVE